MARKTKRTLRKMPPLTRELARLANELASVQQRLTNRLDKVVSLEVSAAAETNVTAAARCYDGRHDELVEAALAVLEAWESEDGDAEVGAMNRLRAAARPFDERALFEEDDES